MVGGNKHDTDESCDELLIGWTCHEGHINMVGNNKHDVDKKSRDASLMGWMWQTDASVFASWQARLATS